MANETPKLKIPMPVGSDFFTRANFIAALQAIEDNAVPNTGTNKNLNLGIWAAIAGGLKLTDTNNDNQIYGFNEDGDSGNLSLKLRNATTDVVIRQLFSLNPFGIWTFPHQPYVSVAQTTSVSLGAGVDVKIPFTTEYQDNQSEFNNGTGTYTPKESGVYLLTSMLVMSAAVAGLTDFVIYANGSVLTRANIAINERSTAYSRQIQLDAGTAYTFYVQSDSAVSLNTAALQITKIA